MWRPLMRFSLDDVIDLHQRHGVKPSALYLRFGLRRVGCFPCIFASKSEIRTIAEVDPERIERIRRLEMASDGATFFHAKGGPSKIDDVVRWSKTTHGGKQLSLFPPPRDGCMRWGMCETEPEDDPCGD